MTNVDHETLEDLLRQAAPRPTPPAGAAAIARAAIRDEWLATVGRRRRQRSAIGYAMAAAVILSVFAALNLMRAPTPGAIQLASIVKSVGPVYVLGERAELRETGELASIMSGQTVVTGAGAGLAVAWAGGGSLRLDQNTRVEFTDRESIFLQEGRAYFDSRAAALGAGADRSDSPVLRLRTQLGEMRHVGTQYMVRVDQKGLVVSVREGAVEIDGDYYDHKARSGEQVTLRGRERPSVLRIAPAGDDWEWIEQTTPVVDVDGRSLYEFLEWVSRELGLRLAFTGDAETVARDAVLRGSIDSRPVDALRMRLASAALTWRIDGGVIYVGDDP
jgi:hypothetical protein